MGRADRHRPLHRLLRGERGLNTSHIRNTAKALNIAPKLLI